jgi:hypothetical protein
MLKILLRKTISSLMLMTLALFLVSFNNNNFEKNERNNFETQQNILNTEGATVTVQAVGGVNFRETNSSYVPFGSTFNFSNLTLSSGSTSSNFPSIGKSTNFFVKFTGYIVPETSTVNFRVIQDDDVRFWVGSNPTTATVIYERFAWSNNAAIEFSYTPPTGTALGTPFYFELDFSNGGGPWDLRLQWLNASGNWVAVPNGAFFRTPPTATMEFNPNGGTAVGTIIAERNLPFTLPTNPTRPGYTFNRWNYSSGTTVSTSAFPLTNTTVDAVWDANQYTVTFDRRGGTGGDDSRTATFAAAMPTPNTIAPTRNGYMFDGYFSGTNGTGTQYYNANMTSARTWNLTSNTTLYAKWNIESYTFAFDLNYIGKPSDPTPITANFGTAITWPSNPTRTGYNFGGWFQEPNLISSFPGQNSMYDLGENGTIKTVYAKWNPISYTVTLDKNNGSGGDDTRSATFDAAMPTPNTTGPTRTGYTFGGYFSGTNGTGTQYYNANMTSARTWNIASNTTLYASWAPAAYTVTLNKNNGTSGSDSVSAVYESAMPTITPPTRSGLTFLGYFDSITGGNQYYNSNGTSFRTWNYSEPRTLFARWGLVGTVTFNTVGNTLWNVPAGVTSINYLVVGGGGGGGNGSHNNGGGGGGAGMVRIGDLTTSPGTNLSISVGAGGVGGLAGSGVTEVSNNGSSGANSSLGSIISLGGTFGNANRVFDVANAGAAQIGTTVAPQGGNGGRADGIMNSAQGGGGAGGAGAQGVHNTSGGLGGTGIVSSLSGQSVTYGIGGNGGRGGSSVNINGSNGINNTGNGGGGGAGTGTGGGGYASGGGGGSGIVIISYSIIVTDYTLTFDKQNGTGGTDSATAVFN